MPNKQWHKLEKSLFSMRKVTATESRLPQFKGLKNKAKILKIKVQLIFFKLYWKIYPQNSQWATTTDLLRHLKLKSITRPSINEDVEQLKLSFTLTRKQNLEYSLSVSEKDIPTIWMNHFLSVSPRKIKIYVHTKTYIKKLFIAVLFLRV